eukprot:TRINITY_DN13645_c0_g1_i1.p1 TRINITY_DN13645_c0_g1~~TRINITY_DN13645_c0_g1_i1.p1  ORF type:complete len:443 (-),score=46.72 TRINITY_DN13645_c0_g1_i1:26-1309(-)
MGNVQKKRKQKEKRKELEQALQKNSNNSDCEFILLLLGTGESGKTTLLTQLRSLFNNESLQTSSFSAILRSNLLDTLSKLLHAAEILGYQLSLENEKFCSTLTNFKIPLETPNDILLKLCNDNSIKKTLEQWHQFQLLDSSRYLFQNANRILSSTFIPSLEDVLRVRVRTTGIVECPFSCENKIRVIDVGGQRSERKKWIHVFSHCVSNKAIVIISVALSEYDLYLYEDMKTNRMLESLMLWEQLNQDPNLQGSFFVLMFTKVDLFKEKLKKIPLTVCFEDFKGRELTSNPPKFLYYANFNESKRTMFDKLPLELMVKILEHLDYLSLIKLGLVCKFFNQVIEDSTVWKNQYKKDWGEAIDNPITEKKEKIINWKEAYKSSFQSRDFYFASEFIKVKFLSKSRAPVPVYFINLLDKDEVNNLSLIHI